MSEIPASHEAETVTVPKAQYDEMVEKLADKTQTNSNLVAEIKDLREKKQLSDSEAEELRKKLEGRVDTPADGTITPEQIAEMVADASKKILTERDNETAKQNKDAALEEFFSKNKEFHPENDEGGLKFASLEKKLARFNLTGLKTKEDFMSVFEDARNLVVGTVKEVTPTVTPPLPPHGGGTHAAPVKEATDDKLSPKELEIIDRSFGGDKERYLKIKAKRPDYVQTLLAYSA